MEKYYRLKNILLSVIDDVKKQDFLVYFRKMSILEVNEKEIVLNIRRLTSGKGRTIIEITGLPNNKQWCKKLAKELKKALGVGGTFKSMSIELHGEKIEKVMDILDKKTIKWKKTGG